MYREILAFFDILKKPLNRKEMAFYESSKFKHKVNDLQPILFKGEKYYSLLDHYDARSSLQVATDSSAKYWGNVKRFRKWMQLAPFVESIMVCNNLAFDASDEDSDIDLFVITAKNRMFTARFFLTIILHLAGVRRHGNKTAGRFCLSFFVSEDAMDLSEIALKPRDVYLLFWMRSLKPLFGNDCFRGFIEANPWFTDYYPEIDKSSLKYSERSWLKKLAAIREWILSGKLGDWVENKLADWQLKRANEKKAMLADDSGTVVSKTMLKFHDKDKRGDFLEKWKKIMKEN